jgi:hypothetical protein
MFGNKSFLRIGLLDDSSIIGLYRNSYELEDCHFSFSQGVNADGKAQTDVRGGTIYMTLASLPTNEILQWMLKSHKFEDGVSGCPHINYTLHFYILLIMYWLIYKLYD